MPQPIRETKYISISYVYIEQNRGVFISHFISASFPIQFSLSELATKRIAQLFRRHREASPRRRPGSSQCHSSMPQLVTAQCRRFQKPTRPLDRRQPGGDGVGDCETRRERRHLKAPLERRDAAARQTARPAPPATRAAPSSASPPPVTRRANSRCNSMGGTGNGMQRDLVCSTCGDAVLPVETGNLVDEAARCKEMEQVCTSRCSWMRTVTSIIR